MLFKYKVVVPTSGEEKEGSLDAYSADVAISQLQKRGLVVVSIAEEGVNKGFAGFMSRFESVKLKDIVILSRQLATLFEAKVSAMDSLKLLASETESVILRRKLTEVIDDVQSGIPISAAMSKHPNVFSGFYVAMVRSGEESGKITEAFNYLADYLERSYELASKVKNALLYPAFVVASFIVVMILMMVFVIPRLSDILTGTGQELPVYTKIIMGVSAFMVHYGVFLLALGIVFVFLAWQYSKTKDGQKIVSDIKIGTPYVGTLYKMFYLSRMADNMHTLISSGVSMVRSVEITADVVGSDVYKRILLESVNQIKAGKSLSDTLGQNKEIPSIMTQMVKIGEETGNLGFTLETMARFYKKEVDNAVDTLVGLIEPFMIVVLGIAVGLLLVSVLGPIYNITSGI